MVSIALAENKGIWETVKEALLVWQSGPGYKGTLKQVSTILLEIANELDIEVKEQSNCSSSALHVKSMPGIVGRRSQYGTIVISKSLKKYSSKWCCALAHEIGHFISFSKSDYFEVCQAMLAFHYSFPTDEESRLVLKEEGLAWYYARKMLKLLNCEIKEFEIYRREALNSYIRGSGLTIGKVSRAKLGLPNVQIDSSIT